MKAVIMAGGKGTRISSVSGNSPKPLLKIGGKPVLEYEIESLKKQGISEIILTVSHLGRQIMDYFGDSVEYFFEETPLGNAGALLQMRERLTEDFLLLNGDAVFDVDMERFLHFHQSCGAEATIFTHPNDHPYDSALIVADEDGRVLRWLTKEEDRPVYYKNRVNAGLHVISPVVLDKFQMSSARVDLDRDLLRPMAGKGALYCYDSTEYVKDMGTPERYELVQKDVLSGLVQARNRKNPQKAIFLDRDGVMNYHRGFIKNTEEFELMPGVSEAVRQMNLSGYLAIVITNQPVIARGDLSICGLNEIHNKMETLLGMGGAYLDALYYCPHHPDKGFEGEIASLKVDCNCRKPKPGMILQAAEEYHIDLSRSWMIGDEERDIQAGQAAGCSTVLIGSGEFGQTFTADNLQTAIERILHKI